MTIATIGCNQSSDTGVRREIESTTSLTNSSSTNVPLKNVSPKVSSQSKRQIEKDLTTIETALKKGNLLDRMKEWQGKALFIKVKDPSSNSSASSQFNYYYYQAKYRDDNQNNIQDKGDTGFFNPASTVKVGISALVLEQLNQLQLPKETEYRTLGSSTWYSVAEDIEKVLIVSDNEATNRLILFLGFQKLNSKMREKGIKSFSVNRLMLDRGTLVNSPVFELRDRGKIIQSPQQSVSQSVSCFEVDQKQGNCSSATDLAEILMRLVQNDLFSAQEKFNLREDDRLWLLEVMSKTPKQAGMNYEATFCRFLEPLSQKIASKTGKLFSKCGIGLFSHSFIDTSFLETDRGEKYYIVFAINPPQNISKERAIDWLNTTTQFILTKIE